MITRASLRRLANARLADASALLRARRYDGALYMAGYVVEMALKARICRTLHWTAFPDTAKEFQGLTSLKTHDLDVLLKLSGREDRVKVDPLRFAQWSVVATWDPSARYKKVGTATRVDARDMLAAVTGLLKVL